MSEEKIKEVHIKTYDEWLKYYENATKEQVIEDLTQDVKHFADAVKDIKKLQNKLQQKENIIKEVRDKKEELMYLASKCSIIYRKNIEVVAIYDRLKELFETLDKGE